MLDSKYGSIVRFKIEAQNVGRRRRTEFRDIRRVNAQKSTFLRHLKAINIFLPSGQIPLLPPSSNLHHKEARGFVLTS